MRFRKPWLKSFRFDFSAKSSSTDYKKLNKPTPKSLAHIGSKKSLVELGISKNEPFPFFTFFTLLKYLLFTLSTGSAKSSSTDYNKSNKLNQKRLVHIRSQKSLVELGIPKSEHFHL